MAQQTPANVCHRPAKRIVICCDGTWCGPSTGTKTNTKILADSFASAGQGEVNMDCEKDSRVQPYGKCHVYHNKKTDTQVLYMPGIGTSSSFEGYLVDAVLAIEIKECCTTAYKFIVEHFCPCKDTDTRIYMFGHSRGAFTVRSVAGMIRNAGILKLGNTSGDAERSGMPAARLDALLDEVYMIYTSPDPEYVPCKNATKGFRRLRSHCTPGSDRLVNPPVEFMGLLDTVGAKGVPKINSGPGLAYEFYDTYVSKDVLHVWQALAVHDRLTVFTPCHISRKPPAGCSPEAPSGGITGAPGLTLDHDTVEGAEGDQFAGRSRIGSSSKTVTGDSPDAAGAGSGAEDITAATRRALPYTTKEVYMPGSHYDIGRQQFIFLREVDGWEGAFHYINKYFNPLGIKITPNKELADLALLEVLKAVWEYGGPDMLRDKPTLDGYRLAPIYDARTKNDVPKPPLGAPRKDWQDYIGDRFGTGVGNLLTLIGLKGPDVSQDAYDAIANKLRCKDGMLIMSPLIPLKLGSIGRLINKLVANVVSTALPIVLADRHIPLYGKPAQFVSTDQLKNVNYLAGPEGPFKSKAFTTYCDSTGRKLNEDGLPQPHRL